MLAFYRALGLPVNEGPQICSVHFGDQKINLHRLDFWQSEAFTLRAPAAEPPCGDFCVVWDGTEAALESLLERVGALVIEGPVERRGGAGRRRGNRDEPIRARSRRESTRVHQVRVTEPVPSASACSRLVMSHPEGVRP